jgi:cytochrome c
MTSVPLIALATAIALVTPAIVYPPSSPVSGGDAANGRLLFERRCSGCHSLDQNREGPKLGGVFGRTSGQVPNYPYSTALKNAHVAWDEHTLDRWLTDPEGFVPGNNMDFRVPKPQERQDIIQFLKRSSIQ